MIRSFLIPIWVKNNELGKFMTFYKKGPPDITIINENDLRRWITKTAHGKCNVSFQYERYYIHYVAVELYTVISQHNGWFQICAAGLVSDDRKILCFVHAKHRIEFFLGEIPKCLPRLTLCKIKLRFAEPPMESIVNTEVVCGITRLEFKQSKTIKPVTPDEEIIADKYVMIVRDLDTKSPLVKITI